MLNRPHAQQKTVTHEEIRQFLANALTAKTSAIDYDTDLVESGLMDSVAMMELLLWLEKDRGVFLRDEDLLPENFRSINVLQSFLSASDQ